MCGVKVVESSQRVHEILVYDLAELHTPNIIALSETWVRNITTPAELIDATPHGYYLHSSARSISFSTKSNTITGGGTAFLINEPATIINSLAHSYSSFEYSSITLKLNNSKLSIFNLYRPPPPFLYSQPFSVFIDQLSSLLTHVPTNLF